MNRTGDKGQPWGRPTLTGNGSDLLPAMQTISDSDNTDIEWPVTKGHLLNTPRAQVSCVPTGQLEGQGHKPPPDPQNICRRVGQTLMTPPVPSQ